MSWLYQAFGWMLNVIYELIENYGFSIILLTLVIKIIVLPLTLKQQKAMTKMQRMQPKLKEIQEKYKDDKDKTAQETMKLYKEYGVSPMGGCLPLLIQFPILIAFYQVIQKPCQYMLGMGEKALNEAFKMYNISSKSSGAQIKLAEAMGDINFDFFKIDLSAVPWDEVKSFMSGNLTWVVALIAMIIPILACVTTYLTSKVSTALNQTKKDESKPDEKPKRVLNPDAKKASEGTGESVGKTMNMIMPVMTFFLTMTFPAALGLYWTASNVLSMVQTVLLNGYYNRKLALEIEIQDDIHRKKVEEKMKKYNMKKKKRGF